MFVEIWNLFCVTIAYLFMAMLGLLTAYWTWKKLRTGKYFRFCLGLGFSVFILRRFRSFSHRLLSKEGLLFLHSCGTKFSTQRPFSIYLRQYNAGNDFQDKSHNNKLTIIIKWQKYSDNEYNVW